ncbi:hypothetical protein [Sulfitobacter sp. W074]|uniref:hypothetical protein n=1 Tax=Sulfitobacter sp. W074 TaxID=2867026 RepID=UPI0021A65555|nr:hypothetical protein [Sulfitobacter sp. W074]UWR39425.1 hypothetical protein K3762_18895 [Sulfitobacter sp. W074]
MVGRRFSCSALLSAAFFAAPVQAQNTFNNKIHIEQKGSVNELNADHSEAVSGFSHASSSAGLSLAFHSGNGNTALIEMIGGASGAPLLAKLDQDGDLNRATLEVSGFNSHAGLQQIDSENIGLVNVSGDNLTGALIQRSNNNSDLNVDATTGSNITYEVVGSGVTAANPASVVTHSGGSITMRQSLNGGN